ncbi:MAG: flavin reductase family protein [Henriciella sp.]
MSAQIKPVDVELDALQLRRVMGCFATGVTVVTTMSCDDSPLGLVVNSFSSVSLSPPLIQWNIKLDSPSRAAFRSYSSFAVNIMGAEDKEQTLRFANPKVDKFSGVDWSPGKTGVPILSNAAAILECELCKSLICGDHEILIGKVVSMRQSDLAPLLFHRGKFMSIGDEL